MPFAPSPMTSCPPFWRTSITMRRMKAASSTTRMRAMSPSVVDHVDRNLKRVSGHDVEQALLRRVLSLEHAGADVDLVAGEVELDELAGEIGVRRRAHAGDRRSSLVEGHARHLDAAERVEVHGTGIGAAPAGP